MKYLLLTLSLLFSGVAHSAQNPKQAQNALSAKNFDEILFVERDQYAPDHHNTETLFQWGEINSEKFCGGSSLRALDVKTGQLRTLLTAEKGVIRDPELSFDGTRIVFSMRPEREGYFHIYEIGTDGKGLRQLTRAEGISDIDPLYMPDGSIVFSSTREPKYCMCNRHIMCNLYRMDTDGANIVQIGGSTLFEGHSSLLGDGRILYDRWEYVDRNFGDAQGLWAVNPDGTKHTIYYGNNTNSPGGVIDARQVPGSDLVACIFGSCHDRPWGALALIDRKQGVDGAEPVVQIWPAESRELIGKGDYDQFKKIKVMYEDPCPLDENTILVSRSVRWDTVLKDYKMALYRIDRKAGTETLLYEGQKGVFDPMPIAPRQRPGVIPAARDYTDRPGTFYVQDVYEGTHMQGVERGTVKWLRVVESPEKRTWTAQGWQGQGEHAPAMNWSSFELKKILGEVPVAEDGSAHFEVPAGTFVYFQLLDKDKKMAQSMRSGTMAMDGEVNGCIGCHEDRLSVPVSSGRMPLALQKKPEKLMGWNGREARPFSYTREVQPIFDRHCMECHDFDIADRQKLVLAGDRNPFFNASYINLYVGKKVKLVGAGPAAIQGPYSWGSHASLLTRVIDGKHHQVNLSEAERQILYAWMDVNGVYYPAYGDNMAGRSPLTFAQTDSLSRLTGVNFRNLNSYWRGVQAQVAFERPELSPCLDAVRSDPEKYRAAVAIIAAGRDRMKERPRADMEGFVPSERHQQMLRKYAAQLQEELRNRQAVESSGKRYDQ